MINYNFGTKVLRAIFLFNFILAIYYKVLANNDPKVQIIRNPIIVIDPGHGGHDHGACGRNTFEKDLNLKFALRLKAMSYYDLPDAQVILTRESDETLNLSERTNIANANKADLFISIHCNSNTNGQIRGAETYVMGLQKANENLMVTARENFSGVEKDNNSSKDQILMTEENLIFLNQIQSQFQERSIEFAKFCQSNLSLVHPGGSRNLRQAGFLVLWQATMPSVLLELGYINNPKDEDFMGKEEGQIVLANSIVKAIKTYFDKRSSEITTSSIPYNR
ncbi:MAG: N-acetylmuramoyl-L-alanine amidase [Saprospiraceae bacterium]